MQKQPCEVRTNPGTGKQRAKQQAMALSLRDHPPEQHNFSGMPSNIQWLCPTKFQSITIN